MENDKKSLQKPKKVAIIYRKSRTYNSKNMACKFLPSDRKFDDYGHSYYNVIALN